MRKLRLVVEGGGYWQGEFLLLVRLAFSDVISSPVWLLTGIRVRAATRRDLHHLVMQLKFSQSAFDSRYRLATLR